MGQPRFRMLHTITKRGYDMTQSEEILQHIKLFGKITPLEALNLMGCFRLASRINDLRKEGHDIKTTMVERNGKRFAEYSLTK